MAFKYLIAGPGEATVGLYFGENSLNRRLWRSIMYEALTSNGRPDTLHYTAPLHVFHDGDDNDIFLIDSGGGTLEGALALNGTGITQNQASGAAQVRLGWDGADILRMGHQASGFAYLWADFGKLDIAAVGELALTSGVLEDIVFKVNSVEEKFRIADGTITVAEDLAVTGNVTGANLAITNWNTAHGWGDHSLGGYLTSFTETDPVFTGSPAFGITFGMIGSWQFAYGWGDHSLEGYLTAETSHADVVVDSDFGSNGILKRTAAGVYGIVTDNSANWNTAFGWGNHASGGYLTGITGQSIKNLSDVYSSMAPADGQVLTYDTTNGWQAEAAAGGSSQWTTTGSDIYYTTGHVAIGSATPLSTHPLRIYTTTLNKALLLETNYSFYTQLGLDNNFVTTGDNEIGTIVSTVTVKAGGSNNTSFAVSSIIMNHDLTVDGGSIFIAETAAAAGDVTAKGQFWVKNTTPNEPWFTDDAGNDHSLLGVSPSSGTFTPTLQDSSFSDAEGQSYISQIGKYTLIGDTCFFWLELELWSLGTLFTTNATYIGNLPFTSAAGIDYAVSVGYFAGFSITSSEGINAEVEASTSRIKLYCQDATSGNTYLTISEFTASGLVKIAGSYRIA